MEIRRYTWDEVDANSWLLTEDKSGLLVDAVDNKELYERLSTLDSLAVILTHSHFDHIYGLNQIRSIGRNVVVYATESCSRNIGNKHKNMSSSANAFMYYYSGGEARGNIKYIECKPADVVFSNEYSFEWCGHTIKLQSFYGHSNDSLVALLDESVLFTGDTILNVPTITRFPGGSKKRFWEEDIPRLKKMGVNEVYPGHGEKGFLKDMLKINIQ